MACLTPATCHSLTSRYSLSASAARNARLRPVLQASKDTEELGTVVDINGSIKVSLDDGSTSYFRHSETANVRELMPPQLAAIDQTRA